MVHVFIGLKTLFGWSNIPNLRPFSGNLQNLVVEYRFPRNFGALTQAPSTDHHRTLLLFHRLDGIATGRDRLKAKVLDQGKVLTGDMFFESLCSYITDYISDSARRAPGRKFENRK